MRPLIFQHTHHALVNGQKRATRRLVAPFDRPTHIETWTLWNAADWACGEAPDVSPRQTLAQVWDDNPALKSRPGSRNRLKFEAGTEFGAKPARCAPVIARLRLDSITRGDVRDMTEEDAQQEGFTDLLHFWATWVKMHDLGYKHFVETFKMVCAGNDALDDAVRRIITNLCSLTLRKRPAVRYDVWALKFSLLEVDWEAYNRWTDEPAQAVDPKLQPALL